MFATKNFVQDYGGVGDGTTNNDAAFYAAGLSGLAVYFPPGTYNYTAFSMVASGTRFIGAGMGKTTLRATTSSSKIIIGSTSTAYSNIGLYDLDLINNTDMGGGSLVLCYNTFGAEFIGVGAAVTNGVVFDIGGGTNNFRTIFDRILITQAGVGIQVGVNNGQAQDTWIVNSLIGSCTNAGIIAKYVGGLYINDVDIISSSTGMEISPGNGQDFKAGHFKGLLLDTCTNNGLVIAPTSTGKVANTQLTNCWAATTQSMSGAGIVIGGGGGAVCSNITLDSVLSVNNKGSGIKVLGGTENITLSNLICSANSQASPNVYDGLNISAQAGSVVVNGGVFGGSDGFPQQQRYGINNAGTKTRIRNVLCSNNLSGGINDSSGSLL